MSVRVIQDMQQIETGKDPLTLPVLRYLNALGVPSRLIRCIQLNSPVGDVQSIVVGLLVDPEVAAAAQRDMGA